MKPNTQWKVSFIIFVFGIALIFYLIIPNNGIPFNSVFYNFIELFGIVLMVLGGVLVVSYNAKRKQTPS